MQIGEGIRDAFSTFAGKILDRPDSTASEQIQNVSLKHDHDAITEDAIATSAVQPDKIAKDCCTAGNISLGEESNSAVKDPEPSACVMKVSSVHREKAHLASRDVDAPACDASSRNADDASVRKAAAPAQTSNRNASSDLG